MAPHQLHYDDDIVGERFRLSGGGLHVYLTGDLLHPPMLDDEVMWSDGRLWTYGATRHTTEIGELASLVAGERVLDVGGGIGGPARLLARRFGVSVTSVTNSPTHAATCRVLHDQAADLRDRLSVVLADSQNWCRPGEFDAAVSINMLYQVPDHRELYRRVWESLRPGGRFVVDDWMLTPEVDERDLRTLTDHFSYASFGRTDRIMNDLAAAGFPTIETAIDLGHVGRGPMRRHFECQMREHFAPHVMADWPGDRESVPGQAAYGLQMVEEFISAVNVTLRLYRQGRMTYRRLLVRKPSSA